MRIYLQPFNTSKEYKKLLFYPDFYTDFYQDIYAVIILPSIPLQC